MNKPTDKFKIEKQSVDQFIGFKEAHRLLNYNWPGSTENAIKQGKLRFYRLSKERNTTARLIYRPDVLALMRANEKKERESEG